MAAVAVLLTVGWSAVGIVTASTASADEACVNVWLVRDDGTRQYLAGPDGVCHETGLVEWITLGAEPTDEAMPTEYEGAGGQIKTVSP